jgi:hypothetical protein
MIERAGARGGIRRQFAISESSNERRQQIGGAFDHVCQTVCSECPECRLVFGVQVKLASLAQPLHGGVIFRALV